MSKPDSADTWTDPDDVPELTDEWFAKAEFKIGDVAVRKRGRPAGSDKQHISLRLDQDVVQHFRAEGPGWQTRMNAALRKAVGL